MNDIIIGKLILFECGQFDSPVLNKKCITYEPEKTLYEGNGSS